MPIRIKFLARTHADQDIRLWTALLPHQARHFRNCEFVFDSDCNEYDFLVVYEDLGFLPGARRSNRIEPLNCAHRNSLFITTEPSSIKLYGRHYLRQFAHILSMQPPDALGHHPGHIRETPAIRWYYGRPLGNKNGNYLDYDHLSKQSPIAKSKDISTVCSDKRMSAAFRQRYKFTYNLKKQLGGQLDWFGRGIQPIDDKAEALNDYRYHVAIENHIAPHHWTEKIADCFLAFCLPFYIGPDNIEAYFPKNSFISLNIRDPLASAATIQQAIDDKIYTQRLPAILTAREHVLNRYNLMFQIARWVEQLYQPLPTENNIYIYGRHIYRKKHPLRMIIDKAYNGIYRCRVTQFKQNS